MTQLGILDNNYETGVGMTVDQSTVISFIISFNLFGEYDNFEVWDAAGKKERREYEKEKRHKEVTPEELNKLGDDKDEINKVNHDMGR